MKKVLLFSLSLLLLVSLTSFTVESPLKGKKKKKAVKREMIRMAENEKGEKLTFKEKLAIKVFSKKITSKKVGPKGKKAGKKGRTIAVVLCWFFGVLGIHRFYLGYKWQGIVQLLTAGGLGVWALIDFVRIITGDLQPAEGKYDPDWKK